MRSDEIDAWQVLGPDGLVDPARVRVLRFDGADTGQQALGHLAALVGCEPATLPLANAVHGKPFLRGSDWRFNLSHSRGVRLLAIARGAELGIDVERVRPLRQRTALLSRCFTVSEQARLAQASDRELLRHWAAKEALVKAIGRGIAYGLARIEISCLPSGTLSIGRCEGPGGPATRWQLCELPPIDGAVGMLVQPAPARPVDCWLVQTATGAHSCSSYSADV